MTLPPTDSDSRPSQIEHPDPLVKWLINNDPDPLNFLAGVRALSDHQSRKVSAIRSLHEASLGIYSIDAALGEAAAVADENSDVDLHIVFLLAWIRLLLFSSRRNWSEVQTLTRLVSQLTSDKTPAELLGWIQLMKGYAALYTGRTLEYEELISSIPKVVPPTSTHYQALLTVGNLDLLKLGLGSRIESTWAEAISKAGGTTQKRYVIGAFIDRATRGCLVEARDLCAQISPDRHVANFLGSRNFTVAYYQLMLHGEWLGQPISIPAEFQSKGEDSWVSSTRALFQGDSEEALLWARKHITHEPLDRTILGFDEYTLIRAELASGNHEAAERLLTKRHEQGTYHYVDEFFQTRVLLLKDQRELAAEHFQRLAKLIDKTRSHGRFDLEMRLATEVSPSQLLSLISASPLKEQPGADKARLVTSTSEPRSKTARGIERIIHTSAEMSGIVKLVTQFAANDLPVLITGPTGTGKELIAKALHESGPRSTKPFVAINCGAISESLIESELFGHTRGAFTGAQIARQGLFREAGLGTLFLDEIGEIQPRLQVALLRVLETGEVRPVGSSQEYPTNCRVIAATNADIGRLVEEGKFRSDLMYRLKRLEIQIPPLKDRPQDIISLAQYFLDYGREPGKHCKVSEDFNNRLCSHNWPGNIRELRNIIERLRVLNSDKLYYTAADLQNEVLFIESSDMNSAPKSMPRDTPTVLRSRSPLEQSKLPKTKESQVARPDQDTFMDQVDNFLKNEHTALRRLDRLKELFVRFKRLKVYEVAHVLGVSSVTASRDLATLREAGFIVKVEPNGSPRSHYFTLRESEE